MKKKLDFYPVLVMSKLKNVTMLGTRLEQGKHGI